VNLGRKALLVGWALAAVATTGCRGDPGFGFSVWNESRSPVIVQFTDDEGKSTRSYTVPPKAFVTALIAMGSNAWHGGVVVFEQRCGTLWSGSVDDQSGPVVVARDGSASFAAAIPNWPLTNDLPASVEPTDQCKVRH